VSLIHSASDDIAAKWVMRALMVVMAMCMVSMPWTSRSTLTTGDELGYWAWQQSWLVDGDLDPSNQIRQTDTTWFDDEVTVDGKAVVLNKYSTGVSQVMLPFTAVGRAVLLSTNRLGLSEFAEDGRSRVEVECAKLGLAMWCAVALLACFSTAKQFAPALPAAIATAAAWAGTSAFAYTWKLPLWSHAAGLAMVSFVYYFAIVQARSNKPIVLVLLGLCSALCVCIRPTHVVLIAPAGLWWIVHQPHRIRGIVLAMLGAVGPIFIELLTRHFVYGSIFFEGYSHRGEGFTLPPPHAWKVMFFLGNVENAGGQGVFLAHPVTLLAMAGLVLLVAKSAWPGKLLSLSMIGAIGLTIVLYGAWWFWNLGFSFGARWAADFLVVWTIGLAVLLAWIHTKPVRAAYYLMPMVVWSMCWNINAMKEETGKNAPARVATIHE
jgi:hypothetical protein